MRRVLERLEAGGGAALERLFELLRIPSVSTDPTRATDVRRAAGWLERYLGGIGLAAELVETGGEGLKAIVPARARAAIGCRLVGEQDPERIARLLACHLSERAPETVRLTVRPVARVRPWMAPLDHPAYGAARRAFEAAFGVPPVLAGGGGTLGILPLLAERFGAPILLMGFGSPGESAHGPDEWLSLDHFHRGHVAAARLLAELAAGAG